MVDRSEPRNHQIAVVMSEPWSTRLPPLLSTPELPAFSVSADEALGAPYGAVVVDDTDLSLEILRRMPPATKMVAVWSLPINEETLIDDVQRLLERAAYCRLR